LSITVIDGSQAVLGLNLFCAIVDDASFGSGSRAVKKPAKRHDNAMLYIAEVACSPREVRKILTEKAESALANKREWVTPTRKWLEGNLYAFCAQHYYADFQRKKTVEAIAKRAMSRWHWNTNAKWAAIRNGDSLSCQE